MAEAKRAKPERRKAHLDELDFANFDPPPATVDDVTAYVSDLQRLEGRTAMGERFAAVTFATSMPDLEKVVRETDKARGTDWLVDLFIETAETFQHRTSMIYAAMAKLEVICTKMEKERGNV